MSTGTTCSGPRARAASAAVSAESTPPLSPTTTRSKPTLRTSSWTKPQRIRVTTPVSIAKTSAAETVGLIVVDVMTFVAEQRIGEPRATQRPQVDVLPDQLLVAATRISEDRAVGAEDPGASPESDTVLEADAV